MQSSLLIHFKNYIQWFVQVLHNIIDANQHTFLKDHLIYKNIIFFQKIIHNYHFNGDLRRTSLKINLHEAYDSIR